MRRCSPSGLHKVPANLYIYCEQSRPGLHLCMLPPRLYKHVQRQGKRAPSDMQLLRLLYLLSLLLALSAGIRLLLRAGERYRIRRHAAALLKQMDSKYDQHIRPRIAAIFLGTAASPPDREALLKEGMVLLAPEIESLASLIRASAEEGLRLGYATRYFGNVKMLAEECFALPERQRKMEEGISVKLHRACEDALRADVLRQWLSWHPESTENI